MTKSGRKVGGILAIFGGGIQILTTYLFWGLYITYPEIPPLIGLACSVVVVILGILGGILLLADKTAGGVLALIAGAFIIGGSYVDLYGSTTFALASHFMFLDPAFLLIGAIVGLAVGSEL